MAVKWSLLCPLACGQTVLFLLLLLLRRRLFPFHVVCSTFVTKKAAEQICSLSFFLSLSVSHNMHNFHFQCANGPLLFSVSVFGVSHFASRFTNINTYSFWTMGADSVMHHLQKWKLYPNIWMVIAKNKNSSLFEAEIISCVFHCEKISKFNRNRSIPATFYRAVFCLVY